MGVTMFSHCQTKSRIVETWFLHKNKEFHRRKLILGICPICDSDVAALVETRIKDGKMFRQVFYKKKVEDIIALLINQVYYASSDAVKKSKTPYGLCYGENKEIKNSKGEIVEIRQKRCDFFGCKEPIFRDKPSYSSSS